jgi:nucleoside-diphosphate-sugar epimerase
MKVLVTGSAGRIGQAIHARLLRRHSVITLDRSPTSMTQVVADITDRAALDRALAGVDAVVHTAALHAPHVGHVPDAEFMRVNVEGTRILAEACQAAGVRRLVFTSTTALYGDASVHADRAGWVDEHTEPVPRTIYHRSKRVAEALLRELADAGRLDVTVLRMSRCLPEPAPDMAV